ncbi:hypothetical protein Y032_0055g2560 [Ancylostoma ceylanicum]|uniref:Uncharacterized protein n=1 Tax=Ancylostoma ceylanicum TaxID=53326 RepID=A0A016U780_9BILA|nr:hypothetical protein Y032_0055g2560 [Ancylostoma ceylanicum]
MHSIHYASPMRLPVESCGNTSLTIPECIMKITPGERVDACGNDGQTCAVLILLPWVISWYMRFRRV